MHPCIARRLDGGTSFVVLGMGYVGLPLVQAASSVGLALVGYDPDPVKVDGPDQGRSHVDDVSDAEVAAMLDAGSP